MMGNTHTIRPATEADIPRLEALLYQVHDLHAEGRPDLFRKGCKKYTREELLDILADPSGRPIFVYESEEASERTVKAYCFCIHMESTAASMVPIRTLYIDDLCVDEQYRGQGIGYCLYEHVLNYARTKGYYNVTLNVWACNPAAMRFYEKCGMQVQKVGMECIL